MDLEAGLTVARDRRDARVPEDPGMEARGLLGPIVEPEAGADLLCDGHASAGSGAAW
jgi:hypothetical protein